MKKKEFVKEELIRYIERLEPNEKAPSRAFICKKWNISRSTADAVISDLQRDGYVYCIKGSGTFVSPQQGNVEQMSDAMKKYQWAVLMPDISLNPKAFDGISNFAKGHNVDIVVYSTGDSASTEFALIQQIVASGIDGMIIIPAVDAGSSIRNYQYLTKCNIPYVIWQRAADYLPGAPQVLMNGYYGGYIATKHLIDCGYRRIAYMAHKRFRSSMDRFMGYCAALSEAGIRMDNRLVRFGISAEETDECVINMMKEPDHPDGFVCFVDKLAGEVVNAVRECGLRIPEDVGVIGFEGMISWLDSYLDIKLSYVDISYTESGPVVAKTLWSMMHDREAQGGFIQVVSPKLVVRDSCKGKEPC